MQEAVDKLMCTNKLNTAYLHPN